MKAIKLTLAVGIVLVSASPAFSSFVKAALGFRLGYSPTEHGYGKPYSYAADKKGVGVQMLTGINNGGWQNNNNGQLKASGSAYGVGFGGGGGAAGGGGGGQGRSLGGGPLDAHIGHGAVKHLRILGLNLYLGGRAAHLAHGAYNKPPLVKKPIFGLASQHHPQHHLPQHHPQQHHPQQHHPQHHPQQQQHHHQAQAYLSGLEALAKPVSLGASVGAGLKPVIAQAPNGGKVIGGAGGVRAGVGTPGFGLGFNLGYKQGINTKSPLGYLFGLGGYGKGGPHHYYSAPVQKGPIYKGHDQVFLPGHGLLKGHGHHDIGHHPSAGVSQNSLFGAFPQGFESQGFSGLESKHHYTTHPAHPQQQQLRGQASHPQSQRTPAKHQGLHGPLALPSSYPRNPFLALFQGRPSILRPTPYHYSFNSPQSLPSGPIRMVLSPHPPTPAPQRPRSAHPSEFPSWSTLFSLGGPRTAASNFVNPIPANGQPLTKLQASLRPGNQFPRHPQPQPAAAPVTSAQNQFPFIHQGGNQQAPQQQQQQQQYQGYFSQALQSPAQFSQQLHVQQPQQNFQQYFSTGFQQQQHQQPSSSPQQQLSQDFSSIFQQSSPDQSSFQNLAQHNFQQSPLVTPEQSPFFTNIQEQPAQTSASPAAQSKQSDNTENFPSIPELPFTADSMQFSPDPSFQYSHSTVSEPVKMGDFTMHMDLSNSNNNHNNNHGVIGGGEQSQSGSEVPVMFGPMGRRLKKAKKSRQESIIKKQGSAEAEVNNKIIHDMMEASASTNTMTLTSSLGSTSWTPIQVIDPPKLEKKSLETPVSTTLQVVDKKPVVVHQQKPQVKPQQQQQQQQQQTPSFSYSLPTGGSSSAIITGPAPALGPQPDRTMILKKRRLNLSSAEVLNVIPGMIPPTSSITLPTTTTTTSTAPPSTTSSTTTTTTTTTSTTTVVPPSSSSSSAPSSSTSVTPSSTTTSEAPSSSSDVESTSQSPVTSADN